MICIYEANETDWHGNGLCILQPSSCMVSEIAGGDFSLTLVHPITEDLRWKELQEERIIKAPVPAYKPLENDGTVIVPAEQATEQCFRIYSVNVDTANHEVTVEARHISYDFMGNMCGRLSIQVGTYVVNALTKMRESLMSPDNRILATNIVRRVSLGDCSFVNPIFYDSMVRSVFSEAAPLPMTALTKASASWINSALTASWIKSIPPPPRWLHSPPADSACGIVRGTRRTSD